MSHNKSDQGHTEQGYWNKEVGGWEHSYGGLVEEAIERFGNNGEEGLEDTNNAEDGTNLRRID